MRTVLIAIALASSTLTACSLYFDGHPTQINGPGPDAGPTPADANLDDGGCCGGPDAGPDGGGGGCGNDAGTSPDGDPSPDGGGWTPDAGSDGGWPYPPDAAVVPDAHY